LKLSVKLAALARIRAGISFTKPTGYNLGKSGWVTASFTAKAKPPLAVLEAWLDEIYRAMAPKKLIAALD